MGHYGPGAYGPGADGQNFKKTCIQTSLLCEIDKETLDRKLLKLKNHFSFFSKNCSGLTGLIPIYSPGLCQNIVTDSQRIFPIHKINLLHMTF